MSSLDIKPYKKGCDYSYTLGAFPTIELLKTKPEIVRNVYVHSTFTNREVIDELCGKNNIRVTVADKLISKLSDKENVFVIGVFDTYSEELNPDTSHVMLVNPSNMGNAGTIIRTCIAFGIKDLAIISPGIDVFNPKCVRASMGALFRIRHHYYASFEEYERSVTRRDCFSFMLTGRKQQTVDECEKPDVFTLIFGNEATGLPPQYEDYSKSIIIPQSEEVDSLNLTIAVGVGVYNFVHKL